MVYTREFDVDTFNFWGPATAIVDEIRKAEKMDAFQEIIETMFYDETPSATSINDVVWHESDFILQQLGLTGFHTVDEGLLFVRIFHRSCLGGSTVVVVAPGLVLLDLNGLEVGRFRELPHQRVVPCGRGVDASQVGVLNGVSLAGARGFREQGDVAQRQTGYIHVEVNTVKKILDVDVRNGHVYCALFLTAGHD